MKRSVEVTLFDTPINRRKEDCADKLDCMLSDFNNDVLDFIYTLDQEIEWGKKYRITVEEIT